MSKQNKRLIVPAIIVFGGLLILIILFGHLWGVPTRIVIPVTILMGLIVFAISIWIHASDHATGSEWWQDDDSSGWRGY